MQAPPAQSDWDVIFVLPNFSPRNDRWGDPEQPTTNLLTVGIDLGTDSLAFAPQNDVRVQEAADRDPHTKILLETFVDERGAKLNAAVCIAKRDSTMVRELEAIFSFRNAVALSVVLPNRAAWLTDRGSNEAGWTDMFDFHPLQVGRTGLISSSVAAKSFYSSDRPFQAMGSPHVSASTMLTLYKDAFLYEALGLEWRKYYEEPTERARYGTALFRSLEIAYVAAASPTKHGGSLNEWGVQLALWVSAIEILLHGIGKKDASKEVAIELLGEFEWSRYRPVLADRSRELKFGSGTKERTIQVNLLQHACSLLYAARNAFLHGKLITERILYPWGTLAGPHGEAATSVVLTAPIVYRMALRIYLARQHPLRPEWLTGPQIDPHFVSWLASDSAYGDALVEAYGLEEPSVEDVQEELQDPGDQVDDNTDQAALEG